MSRPRGIPKTGGRQMGTRNKRTVEVLERAAKLGITPLQVMLENMKVLYEEGDLWGAHMAAVDAAPYLHPKLQSITAHVDQHVHNHAEDYRERILAELARRRAARDAGGDSPKPNGRTIN
jgi:hypothetical protein